MKDLKKLYNSPLPASRTGALYNAFPYPTKISPEAIALYIACHTKVGDTIFDPFAGSGTTGLATKLCDKPTPEMLEMSESLGVRPIWGKRKAILYELSTIGAFVGKVMGNPPPSNLFIENANQLIKDVEKELKGIYDIKDDEGNVGTIRYIIWSEWLICSNCKHKSSFWSSSISKNPLAISSAFKCDKCGNEDKISDIKRVTESVFDPVLNKKHIRKKRTPIWIYGRTGKRTWNREVTSNDKKAIKEITTKHSPAFIPTHPMKWGVLYRKGYHKGITHLHHFYSDRNLIVFSNLWNELNKYPIGQQDALKLLLLSYNTAHSTLMSRVVVKKNNTDFVITGAQSGVLYVSNIPVEKNIFDGLKRKITTFSKAFDIIGNSNSTVDVYNQSSTSLDIKKKSVDYIFTDPPFGDYIPYSEINQLNEAWLGKLTDSNNEVIVSTAQNKGTAEYAELMTKVFLEASKVLKDNGKMSLVFHSAKAEIWKALVDSYQNAGLKVSLSNILDKVQGSFKQVSSAIKVQGDPLLLLTKEAENNTVKSISNFNDDEKVIKNVIKEAYSLTTDVEERKPERLFSRYITSCLESGLPISKNAKQFYEIVENTVGEYQTVNKV